ncbi:coil containing protein [Vibrio phage 1.172.O._10N.261.52.F5]|nr:coil containing protein [Vibrio phage 1.116.O._10N.222.52.C10]AUR92426.1 coil containing protein [Vibrio phage 1.172.O._10N.261.52.F5]
MSFADEWERDRQRAKQANQEVIKVISIELFSGVITKSPVGNPELWVYEHPTRGYIDYLGYFGAAPDGYVGGRFRSNWFLSFGYPSSETTDSTTRDNSLVADVTKEIQNSQYQGNYQLTNNLPYGPKLESGNWSTQAPNGIIAPNILRVTSRIPAIEKIVNKKYGVD